VDLARDGVEGLHLALESDYAVIVLDVMLPGLDGFGVLRALRARKQTPVIMLTARERVEDRIKACAKAPTITWASRFPSSNWWRACKR
jgi:two-component system copper resistance phosphate regulon response regulator CusR